MNSLLVAVISIFLFCAGYLFYGKRFAKLFDINKEASTPANTNYDGVDYVPAKNWFVLFGHHFASIAGAAPIIGPIIALAIWGWGPVILWIILGSIFIGGIHDFGALIISVRQKGRSIANITEAAISRKAKLFFATFVWLTLILVIAVFVHLCAATLTSEPGIVIHSLGLIVVAVITGYLLYKVKLSHVLVTLLGLGAILLLLAAGKAFPVRIPGENPQVLWGYILLIYCFAASITPVQILLQPRDYLSAYLLLFGILFGYLGILISHPKISAPVFTGWHFTDNSLWPMLFVTVACGAVSGFHSLIASGTSSKQLPNEAHAVKIGYGAMLVEASVAILAILAVGAGLKNKAALAGFLSKGGGGPISAFGHGYGVLTGSILAGMGGFFAIVILNAFILTTLDTATRIGRYLTHELFGIKNRYIATLIIVALSGWLGLSGKWNEIWPIFGAANQLVAAFALLVITMWLLSKGKKIIYTAIPCAFMLLTTAGTLLYKLPKYVAGGNIFLCTISVILLVMALYMLYEAFLYLRRRRCRIS